VAVSAPVSSESRRDQGESDLYAGVSLRPGAPSLEWVSYMGKKWRKSLGRGVFRSSSKQDLITQRSVKKEATALAICERG